MTTQTNISKKSLRTNGKLFGTNKVPKLNEIKRDTCGWENHNVERKEKTVLNGLRIRHTSIARGFPMTREDAPMCQTCGIDHSVKHIVSDCLKYVQDRTEHSVSHSFYSALGPNYQQNLDLINFLKQTNIYNQIYKKRKKNIMYIVTNGLCCRCCIFSINKKKKNRLRVGIH